MQLSEALLETDKILSAFENIITEKPESRYIPRDFSNTAKTIEEALKPSCNTQEEDDRYSMSWEVLKKDCMSCQRCKLAKTRQNVVFGEGCEDHPDVMIIGEGPGKTEDETGRPFVGDAGHMLDLWLKSISLDRNSNAYIANIIKCRPPMNRDPESDEKDACRAYINQQINLIKPKAILCVGKPASCLMTGLQDFSMEKLRGRFYFYDKSIPLLCTYHPAAVLRNVELKKAVWEDLKKLAAFMGLEVHGGKK